MEFIQMKPRSGTRGTTMPTVNDNYKTIYIASDHNGNAGRAYIRKFLEAHRHVVVDLGPSYETKVDYPDMAALLCDSIVNNPGTRGVLLCGTGTGMLIAANRFKGIRAGLATDRATAELMRQHNN